MVDSIDRLTPDATRLLEEIPFAPRTKGNKAVRTTLGWESERYWKARSELLEHEFVVVGRGRGGSVSRPAPPVPAPSVEADETDVDIVESKERDLYPDLERTLASSFLHLVGEPDPDGVAVRAAVTAHQGRRDTGGEWSRPDLVLLVWRAYACLPLPVLDVWTFEVKPRKAQTIKGVYEAMSHGRWSTRAYVMYEVEAASENTIDGDWESYEAVAREAGVGLVLFEDPANIDTWDIRVEAAPRAPAAAKLNDFLRTQVSKDVREELARLRKNWIREQAGVTM